jgi:hypothetical protein
MESNGFKIFDNFFTENELSKCTEAVSRPAWKFGQISQTSPVATPFWMMNLDDDTFFTKDLFLKIESVTQKKYTLQRVYANGQTFGQDGTYHQDSSSDDTYTFCIYINKQITHETVDNIGGELVFKLSTSEPQFSYTMVEPIYNRGILFHSNIFHKGLAFNRYNRGLRLSIAWKLKLIRPCSNPSSAMS